MRTPEFVARLRARCHELGVSHVEGNAVRGRPKRLSIYLSIYLSVTRFTSRWHWAQPQYYLLLTRWGISQEGSIPSWLAASGVCKRLPYAAVVATGGWYTAYRQRPCTGGAQVRARVWLNFPSPFLLLHLLSSSSLADPYRCMPRGGGQGAQARGETREPGYEAKGVHEALLPARTCI